MKKIHNAQNGPRFVAFGVLKTNRGQQLKRVLKIAEDAFIKYFVYEGHTLFNSKGLNIPFHTIMNDRHREHNPLIVSEFDTNEI